MPFEEPASIEDVERLTDAAQRIHAAIVQLERWSAPHPDAGVRARADLELARVTVALRRHSGAPDENALSHVERLEAMLSLSLRRAAKRCRLAADRIALVEEHSAQPLGRDAVTARSAAELARRLDRAAATD
jgi:hypothetical protein